MHNMMNSRIINRVHCRVVLIRHLLHAHLLERDGGVAALALTTELTEVNVVTHMT